LHSLCTESATFLAAALTHDNDNSSSSSSSSSAQYVAQLCTADTFGRIVGMFEQNNVGVRRASPLGNVFSAAVAHSDSPLVQRSLPALHSIIAAASAMDECDDASDDVSDDDCSDYDEELDSYCTPAPTTAAAAAAAATGVDEAEVYVDESLKEILDKYEVDSLFQPLDGTALYTLICCMNHRSVRDAIIHICVSMLMIRLSFLMHTLALCCQAQPCTWCHTCMLATYQSVTDN
jgi:hypothetical protein